MTPQLQKAAAEYVRKRWQGGSRPYGKPKEYTLEDCLAGIAIGMKLAAEMCEEAERGKWAIFLDEQNRPKEKLPKSPADLALEFRALASQAAGEEGEK